jgi:hypothetical protein
MASSRCLRRTFAHVGWAARALVLGLHAPGVVGLDRGGDVVIRGVGDFELHGDL